MAKPGEQRVARVLAQEVDVLRSVHLVADDGDGDVVVSRVVTVLTEHRHAAQCRLGDQQHEVEAREHSGGEGVGAAVMSTTTYSPGPSTMWFRSSSAAPTFE